LVFLSVFSEAKERKKERKKERRWWQHFMISLLCRISLRDSVSVCASLIFHLHILAPQSLTYSCSLTFVCVGHMGRRSSFSFYKSYLENVQSCETLKLFFLTLLVTAQINKSTDKYYSFTQKKRGKVLNLGFIIQFLLCYYYLHAFPVTFIFVQEFGHIIFT
jgi:hypothetical protein